MYDAIVVGARCAGSPTAMLLARKGYRVFQLDKAGFPRGADGSRFSIRIDPTQPAGVYLQTAQYIAQALDKVGIKVTLKTEDFGAFVKKVYTDRDFDIALEGMSNLFDPTVGIQRLYWSKNFKVGVPFSSTGV